MSAETFAQEETVRVRMQKGVLAAFSTIAKRNVFGRAPLPVRLAAIVEAASNILDVERAGIWRFRRNRQVLECLASYERSSRRHDAGERLTASRYPGYFRTLAESDLIAVDRAQTDPRVRDLGKDYFRARGVTSILDVPLIACDRIFGVLRAEHVGPARHWSEGEQTFAIGLGHLVSLVFETVERKRVAGELRKATKLARQQLEERELLLENTWDILFEHDTDGVITYISPSAEKILGYTSMELLTHYSAHMTDNPINDKVRAIVAGVLETGERPEPFLIEMKDRDGRPRLLEVVESPYRKYGRIAGVIGVARDVTERRLTETELERTVNSLERSNQDLKEFAAFASHDLKAPLRKIEAFAGILDNSEAGRLSPESRAHLEAIKRNASRMRSLIDSVLDFARAGQEEIRPERVALKAVVAAVLEDLQREVAERGASVAVGDLPEVLGHPEQLRRLFQNLLGNSIQYRGKEPPAVRIESRREGPDWRITVADNGVGIPPDMLEKVFLPFRRVAGAAGSAGSGIGLTICRRIVERHGGRIWIESALDEGTSVHFTLPAYEAGSKAVAQE